MLTEAGHDAVWAGDFDDFLTKEDLLDETEVLAKKRFFAHLIAREMEGRRLSKAAMDRRMEACRSTLDRLLDPEVPSVILFTMEKAERALGKEFRSELV
ncbi:MAG: Fis family transcriptional regulator [Deltaproteobacteria bacterium]|nr:Fis family transcriptional regulator [Deltaproteobacteria bacterium]